MIFRKTSFPRFILLALIALSAWTCSNSDQYLFNNSAQTETISVEAFLTVSFDSSSAKVKSDTIRPGDSLIFLTNVYPSKSIGHQQYFWLLDGALFANEFSFRNTVLDPGFHKIVFVFVDSFGDSLSDTLSVTVANPPILDNEHFIPASETQNIDPDSPLHFAWNSDFTDSSSKSTYHFVMWQSAGDTLVDTLLNKANFIYRNGFTPLHKYHWSVSAENQFLQKSEQTIEGNFFVKGYAQENAVIGHLKTNSGKESYLFYIQLLDNTMQAVQESKTSNTDFNFAPLTNGQYILQVSIPDSPDFTPALTYFSIRGEQVLELDTINLIDNIPPTITSSIGNDTISIADTLVFLIRDSGSKIQASSIQVLFENKSIQDYTFSGDTLKFAFNTEIQSWTYRIMTLSAADNSGNKVSKNFYLKPNSSLLEVFIE